MMQGYVGQLKTCSFYSEKALGSCRAESRLHVKYVNYAVLK